MEQTEECGRLCWGLPRVWREGARGALVGLVGFGDTLYLHVSAGAGSLSLCLLLQLVSHLGGLGLEVRAPGKPAHLGISPAAAGWSQLSAIHTDKGAGGCLAWVL